ncbi:MAG: DUF378 domain-containing protein [Proteobacteria bacterium]|nr:MAG: DUF378 domain-containing protein [Pseudomonadota bacterium]
MADTALNRTSNGGALDMVALLLVVIGALNWLLVGAFEFDLVAAIFGAMSALSRIVYVLVGIAGIYLLARALARRGRVGPEPAHIRT